MGFSWYAFRENLAEKEAKIAQKIYQNNPLFRLIFATNKFAHPLCKKVTLFGSKIDPTYSKN